MASVFPTYRLNIVSTSSTKPNLASAAQNFTLAHTISALKTNQSWNCWSVRSVNQHTFFSENFHSPHYSPFDYNLYTFEPTKIYFYDPFCLEKKTYRACYMLRSVLQAKHKHTNEYNKTEHCLLCTCHCFVCNEHSPF